MYTLLYEIRSWFFTTRGFAALGARRHKPAAAMAAAGLASPRSIGNGTHSLTHVSRLGDRAARHSGPTDTQQRTNSSTRTQHIGSLFLTCSLATRSSDSHAPVSFRDHHHHHHTTAVHTPNFCRREKGGAASPPRLADPQLMSTIDWDGTLKSTHYCTPRSLSNHACVPHPCTFAPVHIRSVPTFPPQGIATARGAMQRRYSHGTRTSTGHPTPTCRRTLTTTAALHRTARCCG